MALKRSHRIGGREGGSSPSVPPYDEVTVRAKTETKKASPPTGARENNGRSEFKRGYIMKTGPRAFDVKYRTGGKWVYLGHVHAESLKEAQALADKLYTRTVVAEEV